MTAGFGSILAVYDGALGCDSALMQAIALARATRARLHVAGLRADAAPADCSEAERALARIVPGLLQEGVGAVSTGVLAGTPHVEIIRAVQHDGHDLVVLSAHSGRRYQDLLRGSLAANLLDQCPCPVWIGHVDARPQRIVAALCAGDPPDPRDPVILETAAALGTALRLPLHVLHAWEADGNDAAMLRSELPDATRRAILERTERGRRRALDRLIGAAGVRPAAVELPRGSADAALASAAGDALMVVGTTGTRGLAGRLLGRRVDHVQSLARRGLVAVKPPDFRTAIPAPARGGLATPRIFAAAGHDGGASRRHGGLAR